MYQLPTSKVCAHSDHTPAGVGGAPKILGSLDTFLDDPRWSGERTPGWLSDHCYEDLRVKTPEQTSLLGGKNDSSLLHCPPVSHHLWLALRNTAACH